MVELADGEVVAFGLCLEMKWCEVKLVFSKYKRECCHRGSSMVVVRTRRILVWLFIFCCAFFLVCSKAAALNDAYASETETVVNEEEYTERDAARETDESDFRSSCQESSLEDGQAPDASEEEASPLDAADPDQEATASEVSDTEMTAGDVVASVGLSEDQRASDVILEDGLYSIVASSASGLALDIANSSPSNGTEGYLQTVSGKSNQVFDFRRNSDGTYTIRAFHSDKVLAVSGFNAANGSSIVQWNDNGTANMRWYVLGTTQGTYRIVSADTGRCLDFAADTARAGSQFVIWEQTGSEKQTFSLQKSSKRVSAGRTVEDGIYSLSLGQDSSLSVSLSDGDSAVGNGIALCVQSYAGNISQKYQVTYNPSDGFYTVASLASGKVLAVAGMEASSGASVLQWSDNGTANMRWSIELVSGKWRLVSKDTGLCIDYAADTPSVGAPIVAWSVTGSDKQLFVGSEALVLEEGYYAFSPSAARDYRIDVNGCSGAIGMHTILWTKGGGISQKFEVVYNGDGTYVFKTLYSNQELGISPEGKIAQLAPSSSPSQKWTIIPDGNGGFAIRTRTADGVYRGFSTGGNNFFCASLWGEPARNGDPNQSFVFEKVNLIDDGLYTISTKSNSDLIISQMNASSANGVSAILAKDVDLPWSKYYVVNESADVIVIRSALSGKVLAMDIQGGNGAGVMQWGNNETDNMKWRVIPDYCGSFYLANIQNGYYLDYASNEATAGDQLVTWEPHYGVKQRWLFSQTMMPTEVSCSLDISISEMLAYQMTNPYITASWQEVLSYLNPDQLILVDGGSYAFADVRGYSGLTAGQLNAYIESTLSGCSGNLRGTGAYFVAAAQKYNLNEMYLLAHAILESGWGTSMLANGYYYDGRTAINGRTYSAGTYYNFYGIGAIDSSPLSGGRSMAIQCGWNSIPAAIDGAASWIAKNYVNRSDYPQITLYDMRWDPARSAVTGERSWHQYATSITWPSSIGNLMEKGYAYAGLTPKLTYIIPRYL